LFLVSLIETKFKYKKLTRKIFFLQKNTKKK